MTDEKTFLAEERCELITLRLTPFAIGWLGTMGIWLVAFAAEGRLTAAAVIVVGVQAVVLAGALALCRAAPVAPRVAPVVVVATVLLGLASTVLVLAVGAHGEILAFMLLTLYLAVALVFCWGWRAELALLILTLVPWMLILGHFPFFVPRNELAAAVTIGATLALAIAEGTARNVRAVLRRRRAQEEATHELQISRDAYRDITEQARDLIWSADREGRLTYVNEALVGFFGLPVAKILACKIDDFYTTNPLNPDFRAAITRVLAGENPPLLTIECATPRGPRWVEILSSVVYDQHGARVGFRGIGRDVQERRDAEAALRQSEERFRNAFDHAAIGKLVVGMDGKVVEVNRAFCEMIGYETSEIEERGLDTLVHPDDLAPLRIGTMRLRDGEVRAFHMETRHLHKDDRVVWCLVNLSLVHDAGGQPLHVIAEVQDISERKEAEEALRASEARFRSTFEDAAIGMGVTTIEGIVLRANRAFSDMVGYAEHELLKRALDDLVHPEDREDLRHDQRQLLQGETGTYRAERRYLRADGGVVWAVATASVVRDTDGKPLYVIGQLQDITERHIAEVALRDSLAELRRSEDKLRLLAQRQVTIREEERKRLGFDLHDDVCQELIGVGILVESLRRKLAPMPVEPAAEFDRVVGYLGEVVEHLRLLAHELRPLLLRDLGLDGSLRSLADGMSAATLQVVTDFPATIPRLDEEAEVTVYRIAQEALANAKRHASARRIVVALAATDSMLRLEVQDDGRGFDLAVRPAAALGLVSMEERALALGGRFEIQSAPGRGTTVVLVCPLEARGTDQLTEPAAPSPTRSSSPPSATTTPRSGARD
jgi:PAS domain S-box-containing protein